MSDTSNTQKVLYLPVLRLTTVSPEPIPDALLVSHFHRGERVEYWRKFERGPAAQWRTFVRFPVVCNADGSPWAPACMWLLDRAKANPSRVESLVPISQDLQAYRAYLESSKVKWDDFSSVEKYSRPTYLFKTHLEHLIRTRAIGGSVAKRRMRSVVCMYRFLMDEPCMRFAPHNPPWIERRIGWASTDAVGLRRTGSSTSTDLAIRHRGMVRERPDCIDDGGKLRPLPAEEQACLLDALHRLGNPEHLNMQRTALLTGAREATITTLRVGLFLASPSTILQWPLKILCGPGTGIDTKRDVRGKYLLVPRELYTMLHIYANSDRAKERRAKSALKEDPFNYLFLSRGGKPFHPSKQERLRPPDVGTLAPKSVASGQALRHFISTRVIPLVRETIPNFHYVLHDLRATFGMNHVDENLDQTLGGRDYQSVREDLRKLLWHARAETTDLYLKYRENHRHLARAREGCPGT
jgi:hypothetical protein